MRYAQWTLLSVILVLAASVAWAQCPVVVTQPVQVQCVEPCPIALQPCPQACPEPCPAPCPQACPCPASVPAAIGAGPAAVLQGIECPNFDPAYASSMIAQNSVIIAVTDVGMQRAGDTNLRDISGEINGYLTSANQKLMSWGGAAGCGPAPMDCARVQAILAELVSTPATCFDAVYARTLSQLLTQSQAANTIGGERAVTTPMRDQAQFLASKEADWSFRLDRWVGEHP